MSGDMRAVVTVSEMARMVGLSRARFYQLVRAGSFPLPDREPTTGRPCYFEEGQRRCLEVRRRNLGIDNKPVLFYARRRGIESAKRKRRADPLAAKNKDITPLLDGPNALGLTTATAAQVVEVTKQLFPQGAAGLDQAGVLRTVFLHLKRQNQGGNEGR
jgi:hypothetical protein